MLHIYKYSIIYMKDKCTTFLYTKIIKKEGTKPPLNPLK